MQLGHIGLYDCSNESRQKIAECQYVVPAVWKLPFSSIRNLWSGYIYGDRNVSWLQQSMKWFNPHHTESWEKLRLFFSIKASLVSDIVLFAMKGIVITVDAERNLFSNKNLE